MSARWVVVFAVVVMGLAAAVAYADSGRPSLSTHGVGAVRFGVLKRQAVAELSRVLGRPSARFGSDECGPRYTEVEWGHLYAEFRRGKLSGFRYMTGAWSRHGVFPGPVGPVIPKMETPRGIGLGSTLRHLRIRYGKLRRVGTDRWQSHNGLVFYVSAGTHKPSPSSRITEIKYGVCGD